MQVEAAATAAAADVRQTLSRQQQSLQALRWNDPGAAPWRAEAASLLHARRELMRVERRDAVCASSRRSTALPGPVFGASRATAIDLEAQLACGTGAQRLSAPTFSRSYFVPMSDGLGLEMIDLCIPVQRAGRADGWWSRRSRSPAAGGIGGRGDGAHARALVHRERRRALARTGVRRGGGVFVAERIIDLPGQSLQLRVDSTRGSPSLIPNLAVALVLGPVAGAGGGGGAAGARRAPPFAAEARLAETLAFRKAMEDSLVTGLRARDLNGRITHVNPAFCEMVGFSADELMAPATPPYWPPELADEYARRQSVRLGGAPMVPGRSVQEARRLRDHLHAPQRRALPGADLRGAAGRRPGPHAGWMSSVLDLSAQRRAEELSRQQQDGCRPPRAWPRWARWPRC